MLILAVRLTVKTGSEAEAARLMRILEIESRKEQGCLLYIAQQHLEHSNRFLIYEQYKDQAALDAHRETPHFKTHAHALYQLVDVREADLYRPV